MIESKPLLDPSGFEKEILHFLNAFKYDGPLSSLDHISAVSRYFSRLPYENISKILKKGQSGTDLRLRLPDELTHDHYAWHLGGTCFSLTYFLCGIYTILGYEVSPLVCSLNWGENNHSAVVVQLAGRRYLVDPGYMIFKPLPLMKENVQALLSAETGLSLRFDRNTERYSLFTFRKGQFVRRYQFEDKPTSWDSFATHWQNSFELPGMEALTLTRIEGNEMLFIQGDFIKITAPEQIQKNRDHNLAEKLIRDRFQIPLEKLEAARHLLKESAR